MAASPVAAISAPPAPPSTSKTCPAGPATPMGLRTGGGPEASVGAKALPRTHAAMAAAAAHATGRQRREGSEPVGKSSRTNTTNPMPAKYIQPSQGPGEVQQQQPDGDGRRIRQASGGQEPADRVRRALPREQRADGGESHDENHHDRASHHVSLAAKFRGQRVNVVVDQGAPGRGYGQHPEAQRSPEGSPWRHGAATGGLRRSRGTRCHLSPLPMIIRRPTYGQKGASPYPAEGHHQARGEASITGTARTPLAGAGSPPGRAHLERERPAYPYVAGAAIRPSIHVTSSRRDGGRRAHNAC